MIPPIKESSHTKQHPSSYQGVLLFGRPISPRPPDSVACPRGGWPPPSRRGAFLGRGLFSLEVLVLPMMIDVFV